MAERFIPVAAPVLAGREKEYVTECLETSWISSSGAYLDRFESEFARFCGVKHAIACCNGTIALHLALLALGVGPGDEVIVPTLTFVATSNAVLYCGATPVFVDSEAGTWNIDPSLIEARITPRTKGIISVHLYGHPADMEAIRIIAQRHGLFVLEDAAEAHGAECHGKIAGSLGDASTFSFYGNKIITTGEGGMVTTDNDELAARVRLLKGQGMDPHRRYWFPVVGYNYRMTNVAAAIGLAQLEKFDWHLERRLEVASWYREMLGDVPGLSFQETQPWAKHAFWMFTVRVDEERSARRDQIMADLLARGIETRPVFYPIHQMPPYVAQFGEQSLPVAERIAYSGINLPTWAGLTRQDVRYVCDSLLAAMSAPSEARVSRP